MKLKYITPKPVFQSYSLGIFLREHEATPYILCAIDSNRNPQLDWGFLGIDLKPDKMNKKMANNLLGEYSNRVNGVLLRKSMSWG